MFWTDGFMKSSHNQVLGMKKQNYFVWPGASVLAHEYIGFEVNGVHS